MEVVAVYLAMLPRLQATESLQRITEMAIGGGNVEKRDSRRIIRSLGRQASGEPEQRARGSTREQLEVMGIPVVTD